MKRLSDKASARIVLLAFVAWMIIGVGAIMIGSY